MSLEELTHEYVAIPDYEALELDSFISIKPDTSISRKNQPILPLLKISKESLEVIQAEVPSFALPRAYPDFNNIGGLVKESKSILVNHWNDPLRIPVGTDAPHVRTCLFCKTFNLCLFYICSLLKLWKNA